MSLSRKIINSISEEQWGRLDYPNEAHGIIDPNGKFHKMRPKENHFKKLSELLGVRNLSEYPDKEVESKAFEDGYIMVGLAGENSAMGASWTIKPENKSKPPVNKFRQLVSKYWSDKDSFDYSTAGGEVPNFTFDTSLFIKYGTFKPFNKDMTEPRSA